MKEQICGKYHDEDSFCPYCERIHFAQMVLSNINIRGIPQRIRTVINTCKKILKDYAINTDKYLVTKCDDNLIVFTLAKLTNGHKTIQFTGIFLSDDNKHVNEISLPYLS